MIAKKGDYVKMDGKVFFYYFARHCVSSFDNAQIIGQVLRKVSRGRIKVLVVGLLPKEECSIFEVSEVAFNKILNKTFLIPADDTSLATEYEYTEGCEWANNISTAMNTFERFFA